MQMRAILYRPDDREMILTVGNFIAHLMECPNCGEAVKTEGPRRQSLVDAVALLDRISGEDLSADDLREIDTAAAGIQVHGARLPEAVLRMTQA